MRKSTRTAIGVSNLSSRRWLRFDRSPCDDDAAVVYAAVRHGLEIRGQVIGPYDLQIAAICLLHGLTLVTSNVREFSRVPGLLIEDWLHV